MAQNFTKVDPTQSAATKAQLLLQFIASMRQTYNLGQQVIGIMNNNFTSPSTFTALESLFGLPAGSGQTVFNLVNGSTGAMVGTFQNSSCLDITNEVG